MIQNGWCVFFRFCVHEYLHIGCVDIAQSAVSEFGHQVLAQNVPVKVAR